MKRYEGTGIQSTALGSVAEQPFSQEKPPPLWVRVPKGVASKDVGVVISQDAQSVGARPSHGSARHGGDSEHGTAQETGRRMVEPVSDIPCQLRVPS